MGLILFLFLSNCLLLMLLSQGSIGEHVSTFYDLKMFNINNIIFSEANVLYLI